MLCAEAELQILALIESTLHCCNLQSVVQVAVCDVLVLFLSCVGPVPVLWWSCSCLVSFKQYHVVQTLRHKLLLCFYKVTNAISQPDPTVLHLTSKPCIWSEMF